MIFKYANLFMQMILNIEGLLQKGLEFCPLQWENEDLSAWKLMIFSGFHCLCTSNGKSLRLKELIQLTIWKAWLNTTLQLKCVPAFCFCWCMQQWINYAFRASILILQYLTIVSFSEWHFNLVLKKMQEWARKFSVQDNILVNSIVTYTSIFYELFQEKI